MHILGLLGLYFDAVVVEVKKYLLFFRLALAILWPFALNYLKKSYCMTILCIKNTQIIKSNVKYYHMTYLHDPTWTIDILHTSSTYYRSKKFKNPVFCKLHWFFFSIFRTALIAQIFVVCLQNRVGILFYSFTCISKINLRGLFYNKAVNTVGIPRDYTNHV